MTIGMDQRPPHKGSNCMMKIEQAVCNIETEMTSEVLGHHSIILRAYVDACSVRKCALSLFPFAALGILVERG